MRVCERGACDAYLRRRPSRKSNERFDGNEPAGKARRARTLSGVIGTVLRVVHLICESNTSIHACGSSSGGEKTALFAPFIYKMHYFTKTGSGQT